MTTPMTPGEKRAQLAKSGRELADRAFKAIHSSREVGARVQTKGFTRPEIDGAITELRRHGWEARLTFGVDQRDGAHLLIRPLPPAHQNESPSDDQREQ